MNNDETGKPTMRLELRSTILENWILYHFSSNTTRSLYLIYRRMMMCPPGDGSNPSPQAMATMAAFRIWGAKSLKVVE
jgi:hypothetical protein